MEVSAAGCVTVWAGGIGVDLVGGGTVAQRTGHFLTRRTSMPSFLGCDPPPCRFERALAFRRKIALTGSVAGTDLMTSAVKGSLRLPTRSVDELTAAGWPLLNRPSPGLSELRGVGNTSREGLAFWAAGCSLKRGCAGRLGVAAIQRRLIHGHFTSAMGPFR